MFMGAAVHSALRSCRCSQEGFADDSKPSKADDLCLRGEPRMYRHSGRAPRSSRFSTRDEIRCLHRLCQSQTRSRARRPLAELGAPPHLRATSKRLGASEGA